MSVRTRAKLVTEALLKAGDDSLTLRANVWLNLRHRTLCSSWPWTFLKKRITGVALAAGTAALTIGAGSGGVTLEIQRILDPLWLYNAGFSSRGRVRIRAQFEGSLNQDETINDSTLHRGQPDVLKVKTNSVWGRWDLIPNPVPDKAYLLAIDYIEMPADIDETSTGDSSIPIYPNDATLIKGIVADARAFINGVDSSDAAAAEAAYEASLVQDRIRYGFVDGDNNTLRLDAKTFRY